MGAAASTAEDGRADLVQTASQVAEEAGTAAEATGDSSAALIQEASEEVASAGRDAATRLVDLVPEPQKEQASQVLEQVQAKLTTEQLSAAADIVGDGLAKLPAGAVLASLGAALAQCSDMAPDVVDAVGSALMFAGKHLGPITAAAGFLGALVYTFQLSKDQDKNVKTVKLWSASVRDWLVLVAGLVERSAAESTLPLFEGLRNEMESMFNQVDKHQKKWRLSKMFSSASFQRDFERAKTSVLELKTALRDFLDQEAQALQERQLAVIADANIDVAHKLETMEDQLADIRAMLKAQREGTATTTTTTQSGAATIMDEEEQIYCSIQAATGLPGPVKFKDFVVAFECFFFSAKDMGNELKRACCCDTSGDSSIAGGLRYAIDRDCKVRRFVAAFLTARAQGTVTKLDWVKFFRQWKDSEMPMEAYVVKLSQEAPLTLGAQVAGVANACAQQLTGASSLGYASASKAAERAAGVGDQLAKKATSMFNKK